MKNSMLFTIVLMFISSSCNAQLVKTVQDSKKLMTERGDYIGKPFKYLLNDIKPEIKFAYGAPDIVYENSSGTYIKFFYVSKEEFIEREKKNEKPTGISVTFEFEKDSKRKSIPVGGINTSKKYLLKEYGDMIISRIFITGEN